LMAAASRLAPAAGNTSQPKKMVATNQRITGYLQREFRRQ
jgi:hypothetical protein